MNESTIPIRIDMRIPGPWSHPKELIEQLPTDWQLTPEGFTLPDDTKVQFGALPPDHEFAQIFRSSCRSPATEDELATLDDYRVNVILSGPGGSLPAAHTMMQAAAALVHAGAAGVFLDNSALAHGGQHWLEMTEDGSPDALSFAFAGIIRGDTEVWTMGMHVLGLRDIVMKRADADAGDWDIIEVIRYVCRSDTPIEDGHVLADLDGPRFRAFVQESPEMAAESPMYNPFGRLKLVSMRDIAERN